MISTTMNWVGVNVMHSIGWALLHFLWQGTALAALAAVLMAMCRRASVRYVVAVAALVLMLAAPIATFFVHWQRASNGSRATLTHALAPLREKTGHIAAASAPLLSSPLLSASPESSRRLLPWLVEAWLLGVVFFSLRSAGGFLLLERARRRQARPLTDRVLEICRMLQGRLGLERSIRYCECKWLEAPAVIGWFRPVVFLPLTALSGLSEAQLEAVIAHELAHIKRLDAFVNVFQVVVETLLFYHPAVWWLNKRIRAEREHCCDDVAVSLCGDAVEYARALTIMEEWRSAPALAMAVNRGPLTERVLRLLGLKTLGSGMRGVSFTGSVLCLSAALFAGNALLAVAHPLAKVHANEASLRLALAAAVPLPQSQPAAKAVPAQTSDPSPKPSAARAESGEAQPSSAGSYIDSMKAAGLGDLSVDQLVSLKIQGVNAAYISGLREQGLKPDVDGIISMKIQGVSPEYIRELKAQGLNPDQDQIVELKIQGVDAGYINALKAAGIQADLDQIVAMKIQGVTPAYVQGMRDLSLKPGADELVAMRIQGVTPEYVRELRAAGLNPTIEQLISMRIQGVTPDYVKALHSSGMRDFNTDADPYISAKIQDITPEFVGQALKHGFKDLDLDKLIQLRQMGIMESKADL